MRSAGRARRSRGQLRRALTDRGGHRREQPGQRRVVGGDRAGGDQLRQRRLASADVGQQPAPVERRGAVPAAGGAARACRWAACSATRSATTGASRRSGRSHRARPRSRGPPRPPRRRPGWAAPAGSSPGRAAGRPRRRPGPSRRPGEAAAPARPAPYDGRRAVVSRRRHRGSAAPGPPGAAARPQSGSRRNMSGPGPARLSLTTAPHNRIPGGRHHERTRRA